jgi:hypothetical protein
MKRSYQPSAFSPQLFAENAAVGSFSSASREMKRPPAANKLIADG